MTTYSELVTQIREYAEVDSSVLSDTIINDFIEHTENRVMRDVDLNIFKTQQTSTLTSSNPFLSLPGGSTITQESLVTVTSVQIYPATGTATRTFLEFKEMSYINEFYPTRTSTGTPKYYSHWDHNTLYLAPTPDAAYNVELGITRMPTRLSSSNTTTWISNNAQAVLLYGCLAEVFKFLKGPVDMLQMYEASYQSAIKRLGLEQQGKNRRDEYMEGKLHVPLPQQAPRQ
jgi:hypothetical protein